MEGTVQYEGSGDVFLTFYNGNTVLENMPVKDNPEGLSFEYAECDKGAHISWNRKKWTPIVNNLNGSKTKCDLYFSQNVANDYFEKLAKKDTTNLAYDGIEMLMGNGTYDNNLRYIGKYPKNYIDIGDRDSANNPILWRIIGVMNNMTVINDDETVSYGDSLVKIIRANSIGSYSWDSSHYLKNSGLGVNEWGDADLMKLLNSGYEENKYENSTGVMQSSYINNSLYWNKKSGECYRDEENAKTTCDFSSTGLTDIAKEKLAKVRWNTGAMKGVVFDNNLIVSNLYEAERSNHNGKEQCASSSVIQDECTDKVERTTTWDGYIGLIYPSDFGYAVGGNDRDSCLRTTMDRWDKTSIMFCNENSWLKSLQWTITPLSYSSASNVFIISIGTLYMRNASESTNIYPTAYLKGNIKIKANSASDYGSESNPFVLES